MYQMLPVVSMYYIVGAYIDKHNITQHNTAWHGMALPLHWIAFIHYMCIDIHISKRKGRETEKQEARKAEKQKTAKNTGKQETQKMEKQKNR